MASREESSTGLKRNTRQPSPRNWRNSRSEAIQMLVVGALFMGWTVGYSYRNGYGPDANIDLVFGIPSWVYWGIAVPWVAATAVSIGFAFWLIEDEPLVDSSSSSDDGEQSRE